MNHSKIQLELLILQSPKDILAQNSQFIREDILNMYTSSLRVVVLALAGVCVFSSYIFSSQLIRNDWANRMTWCRSNGIVKITTLSHN